MSVQLITWAYQQQNISTGAKFLLVTLANYANHDGISWPGQEKLGKNTASSARQIRRWSTELAEAGLVNITYRQGDGHGRKSNLYELLPWQPDTPSGKAQPDTTVRQPDTVSYNTKVDTKDSKEKVNQKEKPRRFVPPNPSEVQAYAEKLGYHGFDAEQFCDSYAAKGWMIGKNKMVDWKAAARGWQRRSKEFAKKPSDYKKNNHHTDINKLFMEAFGRPPPAGKSEEECRQIYAQRKGNGNSSPAWWNDK